MRLPFVVIPALTDGEIERYHRHIDSDASGWHRRFTESIWRRHQHPSNAAKSGWRSEGDRKRRIIHFYDEYGLEDRAFVLRNAYLALSLSLPEAHIEEYRDEVQTRLARGEWQADGFVTRDGREYTLFRRGDLRARVGHGRIHPEDEKRGIAQPPDYAWLDLTIQSEGYSLPGDWAERPFRVFFEVGLRRTLARGRPRLVASESLREHLPAQIELGCGPSIEAGIPHLSSLHRIYGVSHGDYGFVFRAKDDRALEVLDSPERKYAEMTAIYAACVRAESTPFYRAMLDLHRRGHFVGPIITNNFDCQCADLGLPEISLRRYDWGPYYPTIDYDPRARSLLVIGVHADRRLVQMRARDRGLRVLFIDPEEYINPDGARIHYPVEAPQDEDVFVRATAEEAMTRLHAAIGAD